MDRNEIAALLEALCERPLADDGRADSAELRALCREALKALSQANDAFAGTGVATPVDTDRLTAALAALASGADDDAARQTVAAAALRSPAARLDAQSALAFLDAVERAPQAAPAELIDEILAADGVARRAPRTPGAALWSRITGASWSARRWRMAAACTVLLAAGAATWSAYRPQSNAIDEGSTRPQMMLRREPAIADAPAPAPPTGGPPGAREERAGASSVPAAQQIRRSEAVGWVVRRRTGAGRRRRQRLRVRPAIGRSVGRESSTRSRRGSEPRPHGWTPHGPPPRGRPPRRPARSVPHRPTGHDPDSTGPLPRPRRPARLRRCRPRRQRLRPYRPHRPQRGSGGNKPARRRSTVP